MKKTFVIIAFIISTISTNAQEAGKMWIGGSLGGQYSKQGKDANLKSFNIGPEFGYILSDKLGVGIELNFGYGKAESQSSFIDESSLWMTKSENRNRDYSINPFIRYSFLKGKHGAIFLDGGLHYGYSFNKASTITAYYSLPLGMTAPTVMEYLNETKIHSYGIGFRPGFALNLSEKVSFIGKVGILGYTHEKEKYSKTSTNSYNLSFDMEDISLGAIVTF